MRAPSLTISSDDRRPSLIPYPTRRGFALLALLFLATPLPAAEYAGKVVSTSVQHIDKYGRIVERV